MQRAQHYWPGAGWAMIAGGYVCTTVAVVIVVNSPVIGIIAAAAVKKENPDASIGAGIGAALLALFFAAVFGNAGPLLILCGVIRLAVQPLMRQNEQILAAASQTNRLLAGRK